MGKKVQRGRFYDKKTMFLRKHVGEAEDQDGNKYEMSLVNMTVPTVRSHTSGKWYCLSWTDILNLAIESGINK